jgi:transposase
MNKESTTDFITIPKSEYDSLKSELLYYKNEIEKLKRLIFGQKSERFVSSNDPAQLTMGFEVEQNSNVETKQETETLTYTRKKNGISEKNGHARLALPAHLPRIEITIEPEGDLTGAKKIGENITEILDYIPGKLIVKKFIRPKYLLPEDKGIITGILPSLPIPKGNAGSGLLAHLFISKFVDHLPFYRQVQMLKRQDVVISESTINDWFRETCKLLNPLYEKAKEKILKSTYLMVDETPISVKTSEKEGAMHKGYHWVYFSPKDQLVYFDYQKSRARAGPVEFLEDYHGTIQTDGYSAYDIFDKSPHITLLSCMAHARRKFDEALKNDKERAEYALIQFQKLYKIEREAKEKGLSYEDRKIQRETEAVPVLYEFETWMKEQLYVILPKSLVGQAINYTLGLWPRLKRYIDNGLYEIDNNLVENSIRPVALGRKNYLFAGSHEGAERAAMMYSFLGTCKKNSIEPFSWLKDIITRIPDCKYSKLDLLLPQNWKPTEIP